MQHTATYSPEDNKLRLYPAHRLDAEDYAKVRGAGFIWAPKQELFVAPAWSPGREDLLTEMCGEIGDEDTSLVDRAEQRAERFEDYSDSRAEDAERAHAAVSAIADNIPLGQPILVGHHSEKRARKDAEKIENGMRRAVKMWETSQYWTARAAGAIHAAKYKERPDVRARRIKGLESDERKQKKYKAEAEMFIGLWEDLHDDEKTKIHRKSGETGTFLERARYLANLDHVGVILRDDRTYWSAWDVLRPDGERYTDCPSLTPEQVQEKCVKAHRAQIARHDRWLTHFANRLEYERAMMAESGGIATDKTGPEKGGACKCWASHRGGWSYIQKVNKVSVTVLDNWGNGGGNFTRNIPFDKLSAVMSAAEVEAARNLGTLRECDDKTGFFLTDAPIPEAKPKPEADPQAETFDAMRETLKAGVQVMSAPQLFPTPPELADRMVELADIQPGDRVLEPSVGMGNIARAVFSSAPVHIVAVEINSRVLESFTASYRSWQNSRIETVCGDFLEQNGNLGLFDRVLMNPPFAGGADIKHIRHAMHFLKPGGRLVAICANGPRQNETLRPIVEEHGGDWEELPPDTFKESGTGVNAVLLSFNV
jgi:protein-L-isoaspartate O-methyltransferase